jgi:hypothetical protein
VAQAGLERAIRANAGDPESGTLNNVAYEVTRSAFGGGTEFTYPEKVGPDQPRTLWLINHNENSGDIIEINDFDDYLGPNSLTLYWGQSGTPALEATLVYKDSGGNLQTKRYAFSPAARTGETSFEQAGTSCSFTNKSFLYCSSVTLPSNSIPYFIRLRTLFTDDLGEIGIKANDGKDFPVQGYCWAATATAEESGVTTRLNECRPWRVIPSIFDYTLFTGQSV